MPSLLGVPKTVYMLEAKGADYLSEGSKVRISNRIVFTSRTACERRIDRFRQGCIDQQKLSPDFPD